MAWISLSYPGERSTAQIVAGWREKQRLELVHLDIRAKAAFIERRAKLTKDVLS